MYLHVTSKIWLIVAWFMSQYKRFIEVLRWFFLRNYWLRNRKGWCDKKADQKLLFLCFFFQEKKHVLTKQSIEYFMNRLVTKTWSLHRTKWRWIYLSIQLFYHSDWCCQFSFIYYSDSYTIKGPVIRRSDRVFGVYCNKWVIPKDCKLSFSQRK